MLTDKLDDDTNVSKCNFLRNEITDRRGETAKETGYASILKYLLNFIFIYLFSF